MQCVFFFFFFFLHDAATFFLQHEKEITGEASEKKIPISVLNCAIKRHEAEQEGGGERGFGFFFFFFFCNVLFAQIYTRCCFQTRLLLTLLARLLKPPFGIARLSYVDCL